MKFLIDIDTKQNSLEFVMQFLKNISFIKDIKVVESNEVTNPSILQSIEDYEKNMIKPTPMSLSELKSLMDV